MYYILKYVILFLSGILSTFEDIYITASIDYLKNTLLLL